MSGRIRVAFAVITALLGLFGAQSAHALVVNAGDSLNLATVAPTFSTNGVTINLVGNPLGLGAVEEWMGSVSGSGISQDTNKTGNFGTVTHSLVNATATGTSAGAADTIVAIRSGASLPNKGDTATIDIELVALSLKSVAPVDLGGTFFDVFVEIHPTIAQEMGTAILRRDLVDARLVHFDFTLPEFLQTSLFAVGNTSGTPDMIDDGFLEISGRGSFLVPVSEPATLGLLGLGLAGLGIAARRRRAG